MEKVDFKKLFPRLYATKDMKWHDVVVSKMRFLMIDGQGNPNTSPKYQAAVETLYSAAYTIKFISKKTSDEVFSMMLMLGGAYRWVLFTGRAVHENIAVSKVYFSMGIRNLI